MKIMDWSKEIDEIKKMAIWVVLGLFLVVNAGYVAIEWIEGGFGEMFLVNLSLIGWSFIGWGILNFLLNTISLAFVEKESSDVEKEVNE